jgi:hypothetical protein
MSSGEHLDAVLKVAGAKPDKEGWSSLGEGATMTIYLASNGATLTIARVESVRVEGDHVFARTPKRELFVFSRRDVFAVALDGGGAGQPARRAGFG